MIGRRKCQGLIGLHNFSGADWGGKFVGISKKTWADAYMALDEDDPAIECFQNLGTGLVPTQLIYGELAPQLKGLERFVCRVYCSSGPSTLPALRESWYRSCSYTANLWWITPTARGFGALCLLCLLCSSGPSTLPALRWEMFRSRNLEGEGLPPIHAAILPHVTRANYIAMRDKSYTFSCPVLPRIEETGWLVEGSVYRPVKSS